MFRFCRELLGRVAAAFEGHGHERGWGEAGVVQLEPLQSRVLLAGVSYANGVLTLDDLGPTPQQGYADASASHNLSVGWVGTTWFAAIYLQDGALTIISSYTSGAGDPLPTRIDVTGNGGNDSIFILPGESVYTTADGGAGNDTIATGGGDDLIWGGSDDDNVAAGLGTDYVYGNGGKDYLSGEGGTDYLFGESGDDELFGGADNDVLWGGDDNDYLSAGGGYDQLHGDAGDDHFYDTTDDCIDSIAGGEGTDALLDGRDSGDVVSGDVEIDPLGLP